MSKLKSQVVLIVLHDHDLAHAVAAEIFRAEGEPIVYEGQGGRVAGALLALQTGLVTGAIVSQNLAGPSSELLIKLTQQRIPTVSTGTDTDQFSEFLSTVGPLMSAVDLVERLTHECVRKNH